MSVPIPIAGANQVADTTTTTGCKSFGPYVIGGNLYTPTTNIVFPAGPLQINKSTDGGSTWAAFPGPESVHNFASYVSGTDIICFYDINNNEPLIQVASYDTLTDTWTDIGATLAVNNQADCCDVAVRTDDVLLLYMDTNITDEFGFFWAVTFDGSAFGEPFAIDTNMPSDHTSSALMKCCIDSDDRTHVFMCGLFQSDPPGTYYQAIESDNSLGASQAFTFNSSTGVGGPAYDAVADSILYPYWGSDENTARIAIGSPASSPSWTEDILIDPAGALTSISGNAFIADGAVYVSFVATDSDGNSDNSIRLAQSANLADPTSGWSCSYIVDGDTGILAEGTFVSVSSILSEGRILTQFSAGTTNPPPDQRTFFTPFTMVSSMPIQIAAESLPIVALPDPRGKCV